MLRIMRTTNNDEIYPESFDAALRLLSGRLALANAPRFNLVVCGGTALIATNLIARMHDPSEGYLEGLEWFLREFGRGHLVGRL